MPRNAGTSLPPMMSDTTHAPASATALWSSGLKIAGTHELAPHERIRLHRRALLLAAQGGVALAGLVLGLLAPLAFIIVGSVRSPSAVPGTILIILWTIAIAAVTAAAKTCIIRAAQIHQDAVAGVVHVFQGPLADIPTDRTYRALVRQRLLTPGSDAMQTIEVLPNSSLVWRVNGRMPDRWFVSPTVRVAEVPAFAALAAEWLQAGETGLGNRALSGQRDLTPAEVDEIRQHARRIIMRPLGPALLFTGAAVAILWTHNGYIPPSMNGPFAWIVSVASLSVLVLALSAASAFQYRKDAEVGRVLILRFVIEPSSSNEPADQLSPPVEVLPFSRAPWTEDGRPAHWRRAPGR